MLISEIKNKELRELAELRRSESERVFSDNLVWAFDWNDTEEKEDFWIDVKKGKITKLPKKENINNASFNAIEEIKESYALQDIAVNSNYKLSDLKEIHRAVKNLDKVKVIVEQAERFNLELHDVVSIINAVNK